MTNTNKFKVLLALLLTSGTSVFAQPATLEIRRQPTPTNTVFGVSTTPMEATFFNDALNNSVFSTNTPDVKVTVSFKSQTFNNLNFGGVLPTANTTQTTGLVFGAGPSLASDAPPQGATPYNTFNIIGEYGGNGGPTNQMFTSSSTGAVTGASATPSGTGIKVSGGSLGSNNGAFEVFTTAQALYGSSNGIGSRVLFGEIMLSYSRVVKNPVVHIAGLGGSYRFLPLGAIDAPGNYVQIFFSTELELVNTGVSSTLLSGNQFFQLSGNNILNSNNVNPNGGSILDAGEVPFNNLGAATGSVRVNGSVQTLVYRVYLKSGTGSTPGYPWSAPAFSPTGQVLITAAQRDPFTGDIWYIATSMDKPTQQISGTVFLDPDGLTNSNINTTGTTTATANAPTNVGGTLYVNLLNAAGNVVATEPVSGDGTYLFDNVPVLGAGQYSVQLTTVPGAGTYASPGAPVATTLPTGWVNTGDNVSATTATGSDGTPNGNLIVPVLGSEEIKVANNFGIERLPESQSFDRFIPTPLLNDVISLNNFTFPTGENLPLLAGSDPEDMPSQGNLNNKTVQITTLPTNSTLLYDGIAVNPGQIIQNFDNSRLQIKFTNAQAIGTTNFFYAYVDAAGKADPTPAEYIIRWPSSGPLPIVLESYDVTRNNCVANISWKTSSEINSDKFEIEYNTATDRTFYKAGTVGAKGNSSISTSYDYGFPMETGVIYYFRLKLIKKDGTFSYSLLRSVSCIDKQPIALIPNPTVDAFRIAGLEKGKNVITIFNSDGKLVRTETIANNTSGVNVYSFAPGVYVVRIQNENGNIETRKLVKQ
jgi:hypothetical protein